MPRKLNLVIVALVLIVSAGCAKKAKVDVEADRTALRTADTEWSSSGGNIDSFVGYLAPDATIMPANEPAVSGTDNIRAWGSKMFAMPGFTLSWQPTSVDVAASGDVGYTTGRYTLTAQGPDGTPMTDNGKYVTVWKKDTAGAWKVVYDIFNSDLPVMSASDSMMAPK